MWHQRRLSLRSHMGDRGDKPNAFSRYLTYESYIFSARRSSGRGSGPCPYSGEARERRMDVVFDSVFPVFALIFTGFLCARRGILGPAATESLNNFVVWLALPALLFHAMAGITWTDLDHPGFLAAFTGGMTATFLLSFVLGR